MKNTEEPDKVKKTTLIAEIPKERYRSIDGSIPKIKDIVTLDQGFTFPNGEPGCLVYGIDKIGNHRFEAEVYEFEIGEDL